ncbi:probable serine/threonine-protein kinase PBL16 isoform X3 [Stegodyphus dumicola]|uniref:probable serine/threonine-protein kinase PBL16 isoform X3 n=1 Tax=Stegodyphus dumicola TaxID=202533 RepID=UPI0015A96497|nr:probable serine/threonine-protein kinase PBL16 isoform X3 [Stegodyphus dumicola]
MASNIVFIHDLPFQPRRELCRILDADRRWEELGGNHMNLDVTTLTLIGQAIHRDKSPTSELLNKYSERNGTIKRLFIMLAKMDHQRAMSVLQPYVEEKYHRLLRTESLSSAFLSCSKKEATSRPSLSQLSMSSNQSQWSQSRHKHVPSATGLSYKSKDIQSSTSSKFKNDFVNLNQDVSSVSLQSKMKSLDMPQSPSKIAVKKSPDLSNFKKSCNCKAETVSDNCISEKIKNVKKLPQEVQPNEKPQKQPSHIPCAVNVNGQDDSLPDIMHIPYKDICRATDNFDKARVLGRGGFGTVYKGEWKGTSVAIKRLTPRESSHSPSQQLTSIKQSLNELNILKCCRFDHILPLYAVSLDGANPCLVYQLMVNGSLEDRLLCKNKTAPLTWSQRSHIAECITKGLNYLHTTPGKPLVHGDIKSANILLDANMDAKIGDFGLTREGPGCDDTHVKVTSVHGTECYLPPEYLRHRHLSPQVDIYSYGIVLLEIATGLRPFDPKRGDAKRLVDHVRICNDAGHLDTLRDTKAGEENMIWFRELIQIGQKCSSSDKKKRPPMQEVLLQFAKIKEEMSMVDKIRRLSNDKGSGAKALKLNTEMHLSPIELQLYYDFQKSGQSGVSGFNKLSTSPQNNGITDDTPVILDPANALKSTSPKVNDSRFSIIC